MKLAIVQYPPVYLDLEKTMDRAVAIVAEAAAKGCQMLVFPEAWIPGYPTFYLAPAPGRGHGQNRRVICPPSGQFG